MCKTKETDPRPPHESRGFSPCPMKRRFRAIRSKGGWTLFEILVALAVAATIAGAVALGIQEPMKEAKGKQCATNLAMIEGAKDEFSRDNPGVALTSIDQLKPYLRYGIP